MLVFGVVFGVAFAVASSSVHGKKYASVSVCCIAICCCLLHFSTTEGGGFDDLFKRFKACLLQIGHLVCMPMWGNLMILKVRFKFGELVITMVE